MCTQHKSPCMRNCQDLTVTPLHTHTHTHTHRGMHISAPPHTHTQLFMRAHTVCTQQEHILYTYTHARTCTQIQAPLFSTGKPTGIQTLKSTISRGFWAHFLQYKHRCGTSPKSGSLHGFIMQARAQLKWSSHWQWIVEHMTIKELELEIVVTILKWFRDTQEYYILYSFLLTFLTCLMLWDLLSLF